MAKTVAGQAQTDDAAQLAGLGYESHFERRMGLWENFALGFTYLSPVVGVYSTFALAFAAGGPPMIWSIVIAGVGQLLVSLVFAEVVAQFPVAGGLYPWARRLIGRKWAWITGWIYGWALIATVASVSTGAVPFIGSLFGFTPTRFVTVLVAAGLMLIALAVNMSGTRTLGRVAMAGFVAELVGALFVGLWLLLFERHHSFGALFHQFGTGAGHSSYLGAFLAASLLGLYLFYGFEACGDVAEEVPDPGRTIPKAMRRTIYIGGVAALLITAALILAQPDFAAIISGKQADPVGSVLQRRVRQRRLEGHHGDRPDQLRVLRAQPAGRGVSRLIYSYARDRMVFASDSLSRFSRERHVPPVALTVAAVVPALLVAIAETISDSALLRVISFAVRGHLHRVPARRARGADRPLARLGAGRALHARRLGPAGEHPRADLRRRRRAQPRVATRRRGRGVERQVDRGDRVRDRRRRRAALHGPRQAIHAQRRPFGDAAVRR